MLFSVSLASNLGGRAQDPPGMCKKMQVPAPVYAPAISCGHFCSYTVVSLWLFPDLHFPSLIMKCALDHEIPMCFFMWLSYSKVTVTCQPTYHWA